MKHKSPDKGPNDFWFWVSVVVVSLFGIGTILAFTVSAEMVPVHIIKYKYGSDVTYELPGPCGSVYVEIEPDSI